MRTHYTIAIGTSRLSKEWVNKEVTWGQLVAWLGSNRRTGETLEQYRAMNKEERGKAKDHGGFVGGALTANGPRRASTIARRSLITLDIDYGREGVLERISDVLLDTAYVVYSTHSHTPEAPRYRLVVPLDRDVTPDEYIAASRRLAEQIDIEQFDDLTYEPHRLMYWPSTPADVDPVFVEGQGSPMRVDDLLAAYADWRDVTSWPRSSRETKELKGATGGRKAEDPAAKPGIIGAFCRAYGIGAAIDAFLPGVYERTDKEDRWNYVEGEGAPGALVFEDKWMYSMHGTDPAQGRLLNAFDLVRLHRFGELDAESNPDTPVCKLPSYLAMQDMAGRDERVRTVIGHEALSTADDFKLAVEEGEDTSWVKDLEWNDRKGKPRMLANTPRNYRIVLENHPQYKGKFAFDVFNQKRLKTEPIKGHPSKPEWDDDEDVAALVQFFADPPFYTQGKQNIADTVRYLFQSCPQVHPVKDYLESLPAWDGVPRLDTLVIDYLGGLDDPEGLTRALTRKHFCAAVRRIYRPGCKHDGVLALDGPQGIGKSSLIRMMFGDEWFSDTPISIDKTNEVGMIMAGKWGIEMAELTDYKKSTTEQYKQFISTNSDRVRVPYDKSYKEFPRQCVLFASTNERHFLKGGTGNRRWWVIPCEDIIVKDLWEDLPKERDQIWAEVMAKYKTESPELGKLEGALLTRQNFHSETTDDLRVDMIRAYMLEEVPQNWERMSKAERQEWNWRGTVNGADWTEPLKQRPPVCYQEIAEECLRCKADGYSKKIISELLKRVGREDAGRIRDKAYGLQRRWKILVTLSTVTE